MRNNFIDIFLAAFILISSLIFTESIGIHNYGDSSSYQAMVNSLIYDKDLTLDKKDIKRWENSKHIPAGIYVSIDKKGIIKYGKPLLYPFIAAPFFFLMGTFGLILLNSLFLGGSIICGYYYLKEQSFLTGLAKFYSLAISALFFFASYIPFYAGWITQDEMIFFTCSLVMYLFLVKNNPELAGLIIGIVTPARVMFSLLLIPLSGILIEKKAYKRLRNAAGLYLIGLSSVVLLTFIFLGKVSPYSGVYGYIPGRPLPYSTISEVKKFLVIEPSQLIGTQFNSWNLFFRNILNFFIGRFTGIIWYAFPTVVSIGFYLLSMRRMKKKERIIGASILSTAFLLLIILIIFRPLNYFGGRDFICNRYYFILPAMFFLPIAKKMRPYKLILLFSLGFMIIFPVLKVELLAKDRDFIYKPFNLKDTRSDKYMFKHSAYTCGFPLKYAPLEITQVESFMAYRAKFSGNTFAYMPCGIKKQIGRKILLPPGREIVIVRQAKAGPLRLQVEKESIVLYPRVMLLDKTHREYKTFYYFKPNKSIWLRTAL